MSGINNLPPGLLQHLNMPNALGVPAPTTGTSGSGYSRQSIGAPVQNPLFPPGFTTSTLFPGLNNPHFDAQNAFGGVKEVGNPYVSSDDALLATALKNFFPLLDQFKKKGHLTQKSLEEIGKEENADKVDERVRKLVKEIINRPRLNDEILVDGGKITLASLEKAANTMMGNTNPNVHSADPFHSKLNHQVVEVLRGKFPEWRDKSLDYWLFGKHQYVRTKKILEMAKDPDETTKKGEVVRDTATGFPKKKYSEHEVYLAKNLVERTGLLASLDSNKANGTNPFGSHNDDGLLKNFSIDRWQKNNRKEKGY